MALSENKAPVTGNPGDNPRDRAKYGMERRGDEGEAAARASELNNAGPEAVQAAGGRCPLDGLPAGNCGHLPGPQEVLAGDGTVVYEEGYAPQEKAPARERGDGKPPQRG